MQLYITKNEIELYFYFYFYFSFFPCKVADSKSGFRIFKDGKIVRYGTPVVVIIYFHGGFSPFFLS